MTQLERLLEEFNTHDAALTRIAELEAALRELMLAGYERMGWHRTDKVVSNDEARIRDCQMALDAAGKVLNK